MKLLAACQTLETLEALERNRQADTNNRKATRSVYSDTSPPSSFFHRHIQWNCNALSVKASSQYSMHVAEVPTGKADSAPYCYFFSSASPEAPGAEPPRN